MHIGIIVFQPVHVFPLQQKQDVGNKIPWLVVYNQSWVYEIIVEEFLMVDDPDDK